MASYYLTSIDLYIVANFRDDESVNNWCKDFDNIIDKIFPPEVLRFRYNEYSLDLEIQLSGDAYSKIQLITVIHTDEDTLQQLMKNIDFQDKLIEYLKSLIDTANDALTKEKVAKIPDAESIYKDHCFYANTVDIEGLGSLKFNIVKLMDINDIDWEYLDA